MEYLKQFEPLLPYLQIIILIIIAFINYYLNVKLEGIKAEFTFEKSKHDVKFKAFHELQLEYLKELYTLFVISRDSLLKFTSEGQGPEWIKLGSLEEIKAYQDLQNVKFYFEKGQILIDENLSNEILKVLEINNKAFHKMWAAKSLSNYNEKETRKIAFEYWYDLIDNYPSNSRSILTVIRAKFRQIIAS